MLLSGTRLLLEASIESRSLIGNSRRKFHDLPVRGNPCPDVGAQVVPAALIALRDVGFDAGRLTGARLGLTHVKVAVPSTTYLVVANCLKVGHGMAAYPEAPRGLRRRQPSGLRRVCQAICVVAGAGASRRPAGWRAQYRA